jgi:hypothetical protein
MTTTTTEWTDTVPRSCPRAVHPRRVRRIGGHPTPAGQDDEPDGVFGRLIIRARARCEFAHVGRRAERFDARGDGCHCGAFTRQDLGRSYGGTC